MTNATTPIDVNVSFAFAEHEGRRVEADFSGGHLSSDGGALLLRELDRRLGFSAAISRCFRDTRDARYVEHTVENLVAQRVLGLALGYEDLNDHDALRSDPLLALCVGKRDPLGEDRRASADRGKALASSPTLNRVERGAQQQSRYHKVHADFSEREDTLLALGLPTLDPKATEIVLDIDNSDNPLYGQQEGRFFNAHYDEYCYLPLDIMCGSIMLWAQWLTADHEAAAAVVPALEKIIPALRQRCPQARIIVRADCGFCREAILAWCEGHGLFYAIGLARNSRLLTALGAALFDARLRACLCGGPTRTFTSFVYQTLESWSCARTVIGKADVLASGSDNPRFVVTNLPPDGFDDQTPGRFAPAACYEQFYCGRGNMENRIKEQQLDLFAPRTSCQWQAANQLRLFFSAFAYLLIVRLRQQALRGTALASATAGTIRLQLFKIAAHFTVSCRRIYIRLASAFSHQTVFAQACQALSQLGFSSA